MNYASQCLATLDTVIAPSRLSPCASQSFGFYAAEPEYKVLIVDDDPDIAPLVAEALKPFGIQTEAVFRGVDAILRMGECRYDLVVLDLTMGDIHGLDILRALRELPVNEDVPVLILTANGSYEALARSFGHGADDLVKKPFDLREFGLRAFRLIRPFVQ